MAKTMNQLMVSIPPEMKNEIDAVKQKKFQKKTSAEVCRQLIRLGLDKIHTQEAENMVRKES